MFGSLSRAEINWKVIKPLQSDYGDIIDIHYFDVKDDGVHPSIRELVETHNLPFPLIFINGETASAGYISYYSIARKLDFILSNQVG
ncbi:MAG: hypothetical protein QME63_00980 [Actinomycetota bacterium]|nr:hypothetical protein [Actinomycetota bacterium]